MRDKRDFTETARAIISVEQTFERVSVAVGSDADDSPPLEREGKSFDQGAAVAERLGRSHDAIGPILVRNRLDLFCRQVGRE